VVVARRFLKAPVASPAVQRFTRQSLHLRTGDVIPAQITKIDEQGITIKTPHSDGAVVPHDKVKAIELARDSTLTVKLNKPKRERLLTLPRMQKESPPTHLIRSRNGDYLRGRVFAMDDDTLKVEVRLETRDVPRSRVSRIIWLHPDEIDPSKAPATPPNAGGATRVQAVRTDGIRLTFFADRFTGRILSGRSEILGPCRVGLVEIDQLLIGGAIEQAAEKLAYQRWKLKNAEEPKSALDDEGASPDGRPAGTESMMVGKPAPDFELELLGGEKLHLADSKGKVIVLDFWATWCGPCIQAMPQVERVAEEFRDKNVQLFAVNLQEGPKEIQAMLERHRLHPTVALDRNGAVAEKYGVSAIPQTVVIDREGKVARVFIGSSPHLGDQLRDALEAQMPGAAPASDASKK
jgi:peroxiredoxin